ncbi:MAG: hypothetical protein BWY59_01679 [Verrucomicrobia bacterium ADurb.Bin345]|nr:MAG: hypothetical protein BWY59_01679 [Verrucomicrobia bacterium ADurb.Bin345]
MAEPVAHVIQVDGIHGRGRIGESPARRRRIALHVHAEADLRVVVRQHVIGQRAVAGFGVDVGARLRDAVHAALAYQPDEFQDIGPVVQRAAEIIAAVAVERIRRRVMTPRDIERHDVDVHLLEIVELPRPVRALVAVVGVIGGPDERGFPFNVQNALCDGDVRIHARFLGHNLGYSFKGRRICLSRV